MYSCLGISDVQFLLLCTNLCKNDSKWVIDHEFWRRNTFWMWKQSFTLRTSFREYFSSCLDTDVNILIITICFFFFQSILLHSKRCIGLYSFRFVHNKLSSVICVCMLNICFELCSLLLGCESHVLLFFSNENYYNLEVVYFWNGFLAPPPGTSNAPPVVWYVP